MYVRSGGVPAPVVDRPFGDLQARDPPPERAAVAAPAEHDVVPTRPRFQILEVEAKDVVALDHVRVALSDDPRALLEQEALVEPVSPHDVTEAGGVGEGDRDDPVVGARGARELVARRGDDFDIERQAPEIAEGQAAERGPPGHEEVLMDGIGEEAIGRPGHVRARAARLAAAVAGGEGVGPGAVTREPAEDAGAVERLERQEPAVDSTSAASARSRNGEK